MVQVKGPRTGREVVFLNSDTARLVYRAEFADDGIVVLQGSQEQFRDLLAARADHATKRRVQKRLDDAFHTIRQTLDSRPR